jgi:acyl dehydratase
VEIGDRLPDLVVELTPTFVVSTAIATRDFQPIHHDISAAQRGGAENIFLNALTTTGLVGRLVTDWAGYDCWLVKVTLKLGRPAVAGRTLRLSGVVTALERDEQGGRAFAVEVGATTEDGRHASAVVHAVLPPG